MQYDLNLVEKEIIMEGNKESNCLLRGGRITKF